MASAQLDVELFPVKDDSRLISSVARTISLAFSQDPLIEWLRPNGVSWGHLDHDTTKWQACRIQRVMLDGLVFCTASARQMAEIYSTKTLKKPGPMVTEGEEVSQHASRELDTGAAILLFPPKSRQKWTMRRILLLCKLWVFDFLSPAPDKGTCNRRLDMLLEVHDGIMDKARARYQVEDVWYLEVLAVHPLLQSRGIGGKVIQWLLDYTDNEAIMLECSSKTNVGFYEKMGFETIEEIDLVDGESSAREEGTAKIWAMGKGPSKSHTIS